MGCPNCDRKSVISLSICPSCGTMVNDTVREELASRISSRKRPKQARKKIESAASEKAFVANLQVPKPAKQIRLNPSPKNVATKPSQTGEIVINETNRTLVDFQKPESQIPEWRLQLQNVVQRRQKTKKNDVNPRFSRRITSNAAMSINASGVAAIAPGIQSALPPTTKDGDRVANALKRIERSRNKYLIEDPEQIKSKPTKHFSAAKPFTFTAESSEPELADAFQQPFTALPQKPRLVPKARETAKSLYDTSELEPMFVEAKAATSFEKRADSQNRNLVQTKEVDRETELEVKDLVVGDSPEEFQDAEPYDDFASLSLRFNSGLFDLIIGAFVSMLLLAPFVLLGGSWFTTAGFFGFLAIFASVMFIYLTTTIGIFGRTFGMHLFSLEMIDIGGDEYPTFHQAALSSSVFLLSLAFCGIGFLSSFFDEESRAVHDLVSGTIVVREV